MIRRSTLLKGALALAAVTAMASAHADLLDDIKAAKKIRIAIDLGVPPYGMTDGQMNPTGSDVETARLLAKDLGVELEIVQTTGANRIPFLQTGKADIVISSLSVTPEREKVIDFSVPYAQILSVIAGPKTVSIKGFEDLAGKRVASTRGTTNDKLATEGAKDAQIVRFDDDATLITAVRQWPGGDRCHVTGAGQDDARERAPARHRGQVRDEGLSAGHRHAQGRGQAAGVDQPVDPDQHRNGQLASDPQEVPRRELRESSC